MRGKTRITGRHLEKTPGLTAQMCRTVFEERFCQNLFVQRIWPVASSSFIT